MDGEPREREEGMEGGQGWEIKSDANEHPQNRMQEALTLFDSICNSRWFVKTSIVRRFLPLSFLPSLLAPPSGLPARLAPRRAPEPTARACWDACARIRACADANAPIHPFVDSVPEQDRSLRGEAPPVAAWRLLPRLYGWG